MTGLRQAAALTGPGGRTPMAFQTPPPGPATAPGSQGAAAPTRSNSFRTSKQQLRSTTHTKDLGELLPTKPVFSSLHQEPRAVQEVSSISSRHLYKAAASSRPPAGNCSQNFSAHASLQQAAALTGLRQAAVSTGLKEAAALIGLRQAAALTALQQTTSLTGLRHAETWSHSGQSSHFKRTAFKLHSVRPPAAHCMSHCLYDQSHMEAS